jgi:putative FmdB family regulatory protein
MPTYEYKCENGHIFEAIQRMADDPLTECEVCGAPVQRILHSPAVHFKGTGFYTTDYGKKNTLPANGGSDTGGSSDSKSDSDSKGESKSDSKSDSKKESKPASKTSGSDS